VLHDCAKPLPSIAYKVALLLVVFWVDFMLFLPFLSDDGIAR
jgi:hypothetical protein